MAFTISVIVLFGAFCWMVIVTCLEFSRFFVFIILIGESGLMSVCQSCGEMVVWLSLSLRVSVMVNSW